MNSQIDLLPFEAGAMLSGILVITFMAMGMMAIFYSLQNKYRSAIAPGLVSLLILAIMSLSNFWPQAVEEQAINLKIMYNIFFSAERSNLTAGQQLLLIAILLYVAAMAVLAVNFAFKAVEEKLKL